MSYIPEILAWAFGAGLAALMVGRGGGKAEKLLLAGCGLMLAAGVVALLLGGLLPRISEQGLTARQLGMAYSLSAGVLSLAGLVCLVRGFWLRFVGRAA